ncbi:uncharacterized protein LOC120639749 [Panicum virgatum]|uniref:DUF4220 domain-containing protein n=1 Tax=Panicum virgatum TaxID=38727 RepID=A0A8T0QBP3_PANVG|nr:uncharacterized protein LOC120639749 [Panicum virgatum]KAG2570648.1 hypothetical protein PVAP13_7KG077900 [Panicum virgatum]
MGFSEAVQWWEDWQLRFLVLTSLFIQYFLFVAALLRKRRIPHWFRSLIWLAYLGCDAVVIYALATLFNLHKDEVAMDTHIDTLWAPILLMHLGGQDGITAYSIEDNDNWRRHLLISVSQITVAIYVFRKSWWSDDRRLLRAAILLFVPGILKCLEKPWALKNATVTTIMTTPDSRLEATLDKDNVRKDILSLDKYVQEAAKSVQDMADKPLDEDDFKLNVKVGDKPYHLFVDLGHPYFVRLKNLQEVMAPRGAREAAHGMVRSSLSKAFDHLYTKHKRSLGGLLRAAAVLLTFAVIGVFQESRRNAYNRNDVVITYVLLCCTASLELVSACFVLGCGLPSLDDQISQYNLIGYLARNKNYQSFWSLASRLGCKDRLDRLWCTEPPEPSASITKLVYDHVARGWKEYMNKPIYEVVMTGDWEWYGVKTAVGAFRRFNDSRGQRTLEWEGCEEMEELKSSLRMPFDESVLLWHLTTEFCYFEHVDTGSDATRHSRVMSNYMVYLLLVNPEMLVPGARRSLFAAVYRELEPSGCVVELEPTETILESPPKTKDEMARKIIQKVKSTIGSDDLVHRAWELAHELMELARKVAEKVEKDLRKTKEEDRKNRVEGTKLTEEQQREKEEINKAKEVEEKKLVIRAKKAGDDKMWAVIQGVWVEMLCFSAGRCRGYLHAKSLGKGGEYLSYVWLLLSYMGMETMPEKMQRPELPVEGDVGGLVKSISDELSDKPAQAGRLLGREELEEVRKVEAARADAAAATRTVTSSVTRMENEPQGGRIPAQATAATKATTSAAAVAPIIGDDNV